MERVKIDLKHCYGVKALKHEFDFSKGGPVYAIYAPNGSMKSSLAQTFKDAATGGKPVDRIFPARATHRGNARRTPPPATPRPAAAPLRSARAATTHRTAA